jgi:prepilin-type N-terminal cleavage/methylation domain-containing protein
LSVPNSSKKGFSLTELLIALMIIAEIATFTIPKVLVSQQNQRNRAIAKEGIATISEAYQRWKMDNPDNIANFKMQYMKPYLNYVNAPDTGILIDDRPGAGSKGCATVDRCYRFHNGSIMWFPTHVFAGTATTNAIYAILDPDGTYSGSTTGSGKSLYIWLFPNGRITTYGSLTYNVYNDTSSDGPCPACEPEWWSW